LRAELQQVLEELLRQNEPSKPISLDSIGDAIGHRAVSYVEVDAMIEALEAAGREVESGEAPRGEQDLQAVVLSIRHLSVELGRRPNQAEIAEHAGLTLARVTHALWLARLMQR
jgi:DNA-binding MarR family transcriptional regulator